MKTKEELAEDICMNIALAPDYIFSPDVPLALLEKCFLAGYEACEDNWISVEDELPEAEVEILIFGSEDKSYPPAIFLGWFDESGKWVESAYDQDYCHYDLVNVTNWRPLPVPPKEEK